MIKQFIPQEICLKCQGCCRFSDEDSVWPPCLLDAEADGLLKHGLLPSLISAGKKIRVVSFPKENIFICSLFDPENNRCKIYAHRPFECQLYPFLINRRGGKVFLALDLKCSFAAEKLKAAEFKEYTGYLIGLLKSPHYAKILESNLRIIQPYAGALDLGEL